MNMNMPAFPFPNMPMVQPGGFGVFNKLSMAPPLYVGDLDENVHDETLHDFFSKFGPLHFVRIMRDPTTGKSRGFGYVNFLYPRDAESARQYAQYEKIGRKHIRIMFKRNVRDLPPEGNLFVKNLDPSVTVKDLHNHFSQAGMNVLSAKVATNAEGQSLGYGYVQFEKKEDAEEALKHLQGQRLKENELQLLEFVAKDKRVTAVSKKNIYVKHLPEDKSEEELNKLVTEIFSGYGEIETQLVKKHPKENKYSAFICFKTEEAAQKAVDELTQNPSNLGSSEGPLYVNWHQSKSDRKRDLKRQFQQTQNENNLYVKNLKPEVTEQDLKEAFQQFGTLTSIACKDWTSADTQKKAKFGFIAFSNADDAQKAYYQALDIPEIRNLYIAEAKPYINLHQSKERRKAYIYSQRKMRAQMTNLAMPGMGGMPGMGAMPGMGGMPPMVGGGFPGGPGAKRQFAPFPMMGGRGPMPGPGGPGGAQRGGPRVHRGGWQKGPAGGRPGGPGQRGGFHGQEGQGMAQRQQHGPGQTNRPPVQINKPAAAKPTPPSAMTVQNLRTKLNDFLQLEVEKQRQILGELLFPLVKGFANDSLAPKITGMLIDLSVLEVTEILEFLENPVLLEERVREAMELIESEGL